MKLEPITRLGLIAGNGRFPFLLLDAARAQGVSVVVAAIKEETEPEMDARAAADPGVRVYWLSLGELSRLIETFHREGVTQAVMAGQVRHKQIFSSIRPDWRLAKLLLNLRTRNTDMLLGAVARVLSDEGIELISSTSYLEPLLAPPGLLTARAPTAEENSVESMRASRSSIRCRIFFFHCGGTIWRTGALGQFVSAQAPGRAPLRRLAGMLRQTQGAFASLGTRLISNRAGTINQWPRLRF